MDSPIHIVEPTLADHRGHTRPLIGRLCRALPDREVCVWASRDAPTDLISGHRVRVKPWFRRRIRTAQLYLLLRRLGRLDASIFLPTAGRTFIMLADRALPRSGTGAGIALYVHWLRPDVGRMKTLSRVATRRPMLPLLTTTESVEGLLRECGFRSVEHVPYPAELSIGAEIEAPTFAHVLFSGAARRDKGFRRVVELVEALEREGGTDPVVVQTGGDAAGRIEPEVLEDVARLNGIGYENLTTIERELNDMEYRGLFSGAICLQLYDPDAFADRVSGVTLDALSAGAPIVTHSDTWMARQVEESGAGIAVPIGDVGAVREAVRAIALDYETYSRAARLVAKQLSHRHDPLRLAEAVSRRFGDVSTSGGVSR